MENNYFQCLLVVLLSNHWEMFVKIFPAITVYKFHIVPILADPDNFFFDIFHNFFSAPSVFILLLFSSLIQDF